MLQCNHKSRKQQIPIDQNKTEGKTMMKMNLRKMVMAAAMAAFMVYAPVMAGEDVIIDETAGTETEITVETEAAEPETAAGSK